MRVSTLALVLSMLTCGGLAGADREASAAADAGIPDFANAASREQPFRTLWTTGVENGASDEQFGRIRAGLIQPDGSVVLADHGMEELRVLNGTTGRPTSTVGRAGRGPLEFRAPTALASLSATRIAVLDRMNGVMIVDLGGTRARQVASFREMASFGHLCVSGNTLALTGRDSMRTMELHSQDGRFERAIGDAGWVGTTERVHMGTEGRVACLSGTGERRYAWASQYRGTVRTFSDGGRLLRSDTIMGFKGYRASPQENGIAFLPPRGGAMMATTLVQLSEHVLLHQSLLVDQRSDTERVTSCVIDFRKAPGCEPLDTALPRLLHVSGSKALAVWDVPFPRVALLEVDWRTVLRE